MDKQVRIPRDLHKRLKLYAAKQDISIRALLEGLIATLLKGEPK